MDRGSETVKTGIVMHRLFIALRPPAPIRAQLLSIMDGIPGARWQDDEQLHITLRFIGEVDTPVAEDVAAALSAITAPPLTLRIDGVGRFGKQGGHAVWAGIAPHDAIAALHRKVDHALVRAGLPSEGRAYLPHVTLARLSGGADPAGFLAVHAGLTSEPFEVTHFGLYESHLSRGGAQYEAIARWPLTASPDGS